MDAVRVLAIADEELSRHTLASGLSEAGFDFELAENPEEGLQRFTSAPPDVVLLDMVRPDMADDCERLLNACIPVPVILSGLGVEEDVVQALEMGASDYVTKPYTSSEMVARIQAALRRSAWANGAPLPKETCDQDVITVGPVTLDRVRLEFVENEKRARLTPAEVELLTLLLSPPHRIRTRQELGERLWPGGGEAHGRALDAHIRRLRAKIDGGSAERRHLVTVHGVGFIFDLAELDNPGNGTSAGKGPKRLSLKRRTTMTELASHSCDIEDPGSRGEGRASRLRRLLRPQQRARLSGSGEQPGSLSRRRSD